MDQLRRLFGGRLGRLGEGSDEEDVRYSKRTSVSCEYSADDISDYDSSRVEVFLRKGRTSAINEYCAFTRNMY